MNKKYEIKVKYIGKNKCHRTFWTYAEYLVKAANQASWCISENEEIVSIKEIK